MNLKKISQMKIYLMIIALVTCVFVGRSFAQTGGSYELIWSTIDAGGGVSSGGNYVVTGTAGQPDAGGPMEGGSFIINGGFWATNFGCIVNLTDLAAFCDQWLNTDPQMTADFDGNLNVDMADFSEFAYWWLEACPANWQLK